MSFLRAMFNTVSSLSRERYAAVPLKLVLFVLRTLRQGPASNTERPIAQLAGNWDFVRTNTVEVGRRQKGEAAFVQNVKLRTLSSDDDDVDPEEEDDNDWGSSASVQDDDDSESDDDDDSESDDDDDSESDDDDDSESVAGDEDDDLDEDSEDSELVANTASWATGKVYPAFFTSKQTSAAQKLRKSLKNKCSASTIEAKFQDLLLSIFTSIDETPVKRFHTPIEAFLFVSSVNQNGTIRTASQMSNVLNSLQYSILFSILRHAIESNNTGQ
ncbi:hypothetical protein GGX14DRAFT_576645 [Mycena pura]|uniref:Uncharacterized protein n=1 Tax=Mycena pura TaxID=153505 RepID=A0AAD6Y320_9AGAR|nr:hypothetical protein GGX14DRAFT_576645 [Mycena pura]